MPRAKTTTDAAATAATKPTPPKGWQWVRFDEIAHNVNVTCSNPKEAGLDHFVGLEHLEPGDLRIRSWGNIADGTTFNRVFRSGQVLFGKRRAYQRKAAVAHFDGICSGDIYVFAAKEKRLIPELLPFLMQSEGFAKHAEDTSEGSLSPRTKWKYLAAYEFALPSEPGEQRRIAELLQAADDAVESWRCASVDVAQCKQSVVASLSDVSVGRTVTLGQVCRLLQGRPFPSIEYAVEGVLLLRPGNLAPTGVTEWPANATKRLPARYATEAAQFVVKTGDLLINLTAQSLEDGFLGRCCIHISQEECLLNQRIGKFMPTAEIDTAFLFRVLQTPAFRKLAESRCVGSKIKHLYWHHIEGFRFPLPALAEQRAVVAKFREIEEVESQILDQRKRLDLLRHQLTAHLLAPQSEMP